MGTALNKVLKDVINRSRQMLGQDANYVPGWDCHGLPIEWQVEQEYRKKGKDKDQVPILQFRQECRAYAQRWIEIQKSEFRRLGCLGDWENPYATMDFASEAAIFEEIATFLLNGMLYRGLKSVMWSVVEKTALAEAEVEYHDHTSHTIWVKFPVVKASLPALEGASVVIWTTTPWTIPANRAVAYGAQIDYGLYDTAAGRLVVAEALWPEVRARAGLAEAAPIVTFKGAALAGSVAAHPLHGEAGGYGFDVPLLAGDFVTTEQGTGLVHIAPSHGEDDFELGRAHALEVPETVAEDGHYTAAVPGFVGTHVFKAHEPVIAALDAHGNLLTRGTLVHSYPHSWRSKAPLIFRATAQWFIAMDGPGGLREKALAAIDRTRFVPAKGQNRLRSMIETRPDWCVSRQRAWGVPIAVFVEKATGAVLRDPEVCRRIAEAFREDGADAWWARDPAEFLGPERNPQDYEKVDDILDVWFESGSTHAFVLERRPDLKWPADLYLEGSDQHRGWFHSSLLESCGTRGRAPYDAVLTHGFVVDAEGRKMSKSLGNVISPMDLMKTHGADILRLWVVSGDYTEDIRIGSEILNGQADAYRRLRNTLRYLLANLDGFSPAEALPHAQMPELERFVLHRLAELDRLVREGNEAFDFPAIYGAIHNFCAVELSALYFDIRKDALYCDHPGSLRRRAARTVLDILLDTLCAWLAPVLVFTADEAWAQRHGEPAGAVHRRLFPAIPAAWHDPALAERWARLRDVRRVVTGALEVERREKRIGSSLQARPIVHLTPALADAIQGLDLAELCITSGLELSTAPAPDGAFRLDEVEGVAVVPAPAQGAKCQRCWQVLPEVSEASGGLCRRCADAVARRERAA
jgi:isoleucyl-tRNA synthetase